MAKRDARGGLRNSGGCRNEAAAFLHAAIGPHEGHACASDAHRQFPRHSRNGSRARDNWATTPWMLVRPGRNRRQRGKPTNIELTGVYSASWAQESKLGLEDEDMEINPAEGGVYLHTKEELSGSNDFTLATAPDGRGSREDSGTTIGGGPVAAAAAASVAAPAAAAAATAGYTAA
ncbi:hypothetical protein WN55_09084 [Dufourea novaeangliae]|uniref:Uncharacterized protein n=1 Tax=Dufourea novaeangliae TaxID=178035 RepID=A0A154P848_DUFNO|nr:hypothetical protein WN55_09084 [Dufourea novaeangliae]